MSESSGSQLDSQEGKVERDSSVFLREDEAESSAPTRIDSEVSFFGKKTLPPSSHLTIVDDEYCMSHADRGKVIIFNHETYADNLKFPPRKGTNVDRDRLIKTFETLGFKVRVLNNPTRKEVLERLAKEQENQFHRGSDCLVVVVLTHGEDEGRLCAKDDFYTVSELWARFMAEFCPALATKPKIFIIQACRGDNPSRGVAVNVEKLTTDSRVLDETVGETFSIPNEADILVAYCTYEGRVAYRDPKEGTWYINALCDELDESAKVDDLLTMLTRVNRRVALTKETDQGKQMPSIQSTLTRKIYFYERNQQNSLGASLQKLSTKLDLLLNMREVFQKTPHEFDTPSPVSTRNVPFSWNRLRECSVVPKPVNSLPGQHAVFRHANALKMFLECQKLEDDVQENGRTILILLSFWDTIDTFSQKYVYMRTLSFLRRYASEWPVMDLLDIPDRDSLSSSNSVGSCNSLPRRQPASTSRKSSGASYQNKSSQLPKPRPPFK